MRGLLIALLFGWASALHAQCPLTCPTVSSFGLYADAPVYNGAALTFAGNVLVSNAFINTTGGSANFNEVEVTAAGSLTVQTGSTFATTSTLKLDGNSTLTGPTTVGGSMTCCAGTTTVDNLDVTGQIVVLDAGTFTLNTGGLLDFSVFYKTQAATVNGVDGNFSDYYTGSVDCQALPVEHALTLRGRNEGNHFRLTWTLSPGLNPVELVLERTLTRQTQFTPLAPVIGLPSFLDQSLQPGSAYLYRLRALDAAGQILYSNWVNTLRGGQATPQEITLYPNPGNGRFQFSRPFQTLQVFNQLGQPVQWRLLTETEVELVDATAGVYHLVVDGLAANPYLLQQNR